MASRRKSAQVVIQAKPTPGAAAIARSGSERSDTHSDVEAGQSFKGRRAGKRSDPAFRPTTIFVRKETQRTATRLLEDQDTGKDFSDLVEELVAHWITTHSRA